MGNGRYVAISDSELDELDVNVHAVYAINSLKGKSENEILDEIRIGETGVTIKYGFHGSTLLPYVPIEEDWDSNTFLENLCVDAGLSKTAWKNSSADLSVFNTQLFREESPRGKITEA